MQRQEQKAIYAEMDKASQSVLDLEQQDRLIQQIQTEDQLKADQANRKLTQDIINRNQYKQDELQHGKAVAEINKFFNSQEVQGAAGAASELVALSSSKNKTMKSIGKAAARVNAAIATKEGAIKAYTSLAGIPIVGPALGIAAAAALTAYGIEQQVAIGKAAKGGFVPKGMGGMRDRVPMMLEPNELVVPKEIVPNFIQSVGRGQTSGQSPEATVRLELSDNLIDFIEARVIERRALNIGLL